MQFIKKIILIIIELQIYFISWIIPKNKKIWLFGAWRGDIYADNTKYLFEYINRNHQDIRAVWISLNKDTVEQIRQKGYEAYFFYDIHGILLSLQAYVVFQTEGSKDINSFCCGRAVVIQLWHGTPLKKVIADSVSAPGASLCKKAIPWLLPYKRSRKKSDYITIASEFVAESFISAFRTTSDKILVTGQARTDAFKMDYKNEYISRVRKRIGDAKLVAYIPTHRMEGKSEPQFTFHELKRVDEQLRERNIFMLLKPHFHEIKHFINAGIIFSNIIIPDDKECLSDVYSFIYKCDMLITDYSSIYFDFLYVNKPILFFIYDFERYVKSINGFYYSFDNVTPGPKCSTWEETINEITRQFTKDEWAQKRSECMIMFNDYYDGENCKRIWENVTDILSGKTPRNLLRNKYEKVIS